MRPELSGIGTKRRNWLDHSLCVAPMLDWTDRFCRYFLRQLSRQTLLYTEMITTGALLHGDAERHLRFDPDEHPVALQLGGSDPNELAACARLGADRGYDEINLNLGCPSDRVQSGRFGACLMAEPNLVAECMASMADAVSIPVTAKHRIGIDDHDSYDELVHFVGTIAEAGCRTFIVHARKAWLQGLSPKENREVPPLQYEVVYRLKADFQHLEIVVNGGILTLDDALTHLDHLDGVMMGRAVYNEPWLLADADRLIFQLEKNPFKSRQQALESLYPWVEEELGQGTPLHHISRHLLGLFNSQPGARRWRRHISENANHRNAGIEVLQQASAMVSEE